jgi:hypothetical protein
MLWFHPLQYMGLDRSPAGNKSADLFCDSSFRRSLLQIDRIEIKSKVGRIGGLGHVKPSETKGRSILEALLE